MVGGLRCAELRHTNAKLHLGPLALAIAKAVRNHLRSELPFPRLVATPWQVEVKKKVEVVLPDPVPL
jgi:hypothetical protein